jgi:hypothetical protein
VPLLLLLLLLLLLVVVVVVVTCFRAGDVDGCLVGELPPGCDEGDAALDLIAVGQDLLLHRR